MIMYESPLVDWLALWLCNPLIGSNPVSNGYGYGFLCEVALKKFTFLFYYCMHKK